MSTPAEDASQGAEETSQGTSEADAIIGLTDDPHPPLHQGQLIRMAASNAKASTFRQRLTTAGTLLWFGRHLTDFLDACLEGTTPLIGSLLIPT
jgi:hypothetical protein